jgi:N6-adenosine-specific RNA methylase IME4
MINKDTQQIAVPSAGIEAIHCYMPVAGAKKYSCIYADPPWQTKAGRPLSGYRIVDGKQIFNSIDNKSRELAYPTMTVDEIAAMPIKNIVAKDAFLFLWVTNQYLLEAKKVIDGWGFRYVTCITWKKKKMGGGLGGVVRITSEHLLFCRRGNLKGTGTIPESVIEAKRPYVNGYPCHSKKPDVFAEMIETVCPGDKVELFARSQRKGWDVFGNEVTNSIQLNAGSNGI